MPSDLNNTVDLYPPAAKEHETLNAVHWMDDYGKVFARVQEGDDLTEFAPMLRTFIDPM